MKLATSFIIQIFIILSAKAQIQNGDFEFWSINNYNNNWETPLNWKCAAVSSETGSCDKVIGEDGGLSARVHNVMPCWEAESGDDFRTQGFLESYFTSPDDDFMLSCKLKVDSIEFPAELIITMRGMIAGGGSEQLLEVAYDHPVDTTAEHPIYLANPYDSIHIEFLAKGGYNEDATSSCKKGYISVIIDDVKIEAIVSTASASHTEVKVYPNPTINDLNIISKYEQIEEIRLMSMMGETIVNVEGLNSNDYILELGELSNGVYVISFLVGRDRIIRRIIKN